MSFVIAAPELITTAATDLANLGSTTQRGQRGGGHPTMGVLAAAEDEVSAAIAAIFSALGQGYQTLSAQAAAFHSQFVATLASSLSSYQTTEAASVNALRSAVTDAQLLYSHSPRNQPRHTNPQHRQSDHAGGDRHGVRHFPTRAAHQDRQGVFPRHPQPIPGVHPGGVLAVHPPVGQFDAEPVRCRGHPEPQQRDPDPARPGAYGQRLGHIAGLACGHRRNPVADGQRITRHQPGQIRLDRRSGQPRRRAVRTVQRPDHPRPRCPFNGATPPNSPYQTAIYTNQYDGVADFPRYPLNLIADANAVNGYLYGPHDYVDYSFETLAAAQLPTSPGYTGNTTYSMVLTQNLPLLDPLLDPVRRGLPPYAASAPQPYGDAVADLIQPDLRVLVDMGYGSDEYANIPTHASLLEFPIGPSSAPICCAAPSKARRPR